MYCIGMSLAINMKQTSYSSHILTVQQFSTAYVGIHGLQAQQEVLVLSLKLQQYNIEM